MYTTKLDKLGVTLSRLGFGAMRLPLTPEGAIDREMTQKMVDRAYENGVNYFDTAYNYHEGKSQVVLGEALKKYPRDSFYFANKMPLWKCKTTQDCQDVLDEQLGLSGLEYIDFYLLHSMARGRWKQAKELEVLPLLEKNKKAGKIRFYGFSYHGDFETFCDMIDSYDKWDFVQIQTNYVDEIAMNAAAFAKKLQEHNIPCIVMEPVRGGFLAQPPEKAVEELRGVDGGKHTPAEWAMRWFLDKENMPVILSGMTNMDHVRSNLNVFSSMEPLSADETAALGRARDIILSAKTVPCTACGYCSVCPNGVAIPDIFTEYNHLQMFGSQLRVKSNYSLLGREHDYRSCIHCGACVDMCPQNIQIPEELAKIHEEIKAIPIQLLPDFPSIYD